MTKKKKIAVVATGGTIAGSGKPGEAGKYKAGTLPVDSIIETIPQIRDLADLELVSVCQKDSNDITCQDIFNLKQTIETLAEREDIDGIVITHGTDTLEETAFFLNLILNTEKPVVMTGAMRPATATSADGPMNLYQAVALAADDKANGLGVLAVISDTIYSGRDLTKINSIKTDAFEVGDPGPIGYMQDGRVYFIHSPCRKHTIHSCFSCAALAMKKKVEIFYVHEDSDPALLAWMLRMYDGVVIAGTGSGNNSRQIQDVIESNTHPCVIVRSSRLLEGSAFSSPVFDPLQKTIPAHRLSPHKARILLLLALDFGMDKERIRELFREY